MLCSSLAQRWDGKKHCQPYPVFHGKLPLLAGAHRLSQETFALWGEFIILGPKREVNTNFDRERKKPRPYCWSSPSVSGSFLSSPVTMASSSFSSWISLCRRIISCKEQSSRISGGSSRRNLVKITHFLKITISFKGENVYTQKRDFATNHLVLYHLNILLK